MSHHENKQAAETDRTCAQHGDTLVWEVGGPRMPTIFGRWVCPTCHVTLMTALAKGDR